MDRFTYTKDELTTILHHHLQQESTLLNYLEQLIDDLIAYGDADVILNRADYEELRSDITAFDDSVRLTRMYLS